MFQSFKAIFKTLVLSVCAASTLSLAAETSADVEQKAYFLCKNRKEVRTIRVQVDSGVCTTYYSKLGNEKNVGSGKNQESCVNFLNNIKDNLEKSNWNCRDISATRITASVE